MIFSDKSPEKTPFPFLSYRIMYIHHHHSTVSILKLKNSIESRAYSPPTLHVITFVDDDENLIYSKNTQICDIES